MEPGYCDWNELVTTDHKAALDFYSQFFGRENKEAMSMTITGASTMPGKASAQ